MTADSERIGGYHTLALLILQAFQALLAITKPSSENVYSVISGLEPRDAENELRNPQFRREITTKLQKEAELFFSLISEGLPEPLIGMMVYSLISDVDTASALNETADSESAAQTNIKLQKEAESFFSSISPNSTGGGHRA